MRILTMRFEHPLAFSGEHKARRHAVDFIDTGNRQLWEGWEFTVNGPILQLRPPNSKIVYEVPRAWAFIAYEDDGKTDAKGATK